jgi:hypothetical protein
VLDARQGKALQDEITDIKNVVGKYYSDGNTSDSTTYYSSKCSITLPAGTYVISFFANSAVSAKISNLSIIISDNTGVTTNMLAFQTLYETETNSNHKISCTGIRVLSAETKIGGWFACSTSGISFTTSLRAVRIL